MLFEVTIRTGRNAVRCEGESFCEAMIQAMDNGQHMLKDAPLLAFAARIEQFAKDRLSDLRREHHKAPPNHIVENAPFRDGMKFVWMDAEGRLHIEEPA